MNKLFVLFLACMFAASLVMAAGQGSGAISTGQGTTDTEQANETGQIGQGTGEGTQLTTEQQTQNQGEESALQVRQMIQSGNYVNSDGNSMQIQNENGIKLKVGNVEAGSTLNIVQEMVQNRTKLNAQLSNGRNAEIKIMPDTASETAIARLRLKNCNETNNCTIQLKEVGQGNQTKLAYEVKAQKKARILGLFQARMEVQAQINAENGETIQTKKPWWAFLASEEA
jgi:hypothetical protein